MTPEVKAALERLKVAFAMTQGCPWEHDVYADISNMSSRLQYVSDCETLAMAYLAEHPPDDDEPITEEWLRAVGFLEDSNNPLELALCLRWPDTETDGMQIVIPPAACEVFIEEYDTDGNQTDMVCVRKLRTRSDLRRLVRALGGEIT